MRQVERKYRTHHQHHHLPGTPLIRLLAQEPHTMTIMMDMEPTKLEPDTKVSTRECAGRGRGCFGGCHGASSKENQGGSENPDRAIVTRGKYSDIGKGCVRQMTDPLIVGTRTRGFSYIYAFRKNIASLFQSLWGEKNECHVIFALHCTAILILHRQWIF